MLLGCEESYLPGLNREYGEADAAAATIVQAVYRGGKQRQLTLVLINQSQAAKQLLQRRDFADAQAKLVRPAASQCGPAAAS